VQRPELLSAREAAGLLGVRLTTLYAYVSRGLLRSVPGSRKGRRLYFRDDLARLRARHQAHGGHAAVAAGALRWGEPVLDSALTDIGATGPCYRGQDAVSLAERGVRFEAVAELLWTGTLAEPRTTWPAVRFGAAASRVARLLPGDAGPLDALATCCPILAAADRGRHAAPRSGQIERARRLVRSLAAALALPAAPGRIEAAMRAPTVAAGILVALGHRPRPDAVRAVDRALVLSADHELNPSSFAARIAASTGADLYACVGAALATLSGPLHGGSCDRVEALVAEASSPSRAGSTLDGRLRRGDAVPGFGHPLYPNGDPRGRALIETALSAGSRSPGLRTLLSVVESMRSRGREAANLDTGLVAVALALGLPAGAAAGLFGVGRAAGWIAHALEQQAAGFTLRPRARYVGPRPEPGQAEP
jgi:citrate synthase